MKRLAAILLTAALLVSLAACGSQTSPSDLLNTPLSPEAPEVPAEPPVPALPETEPEPEPAPGKELPPESEEPEHQSATLAQKLCGLYRSEEFDGEYEILELRRYGNLLLLEVDSYQLEDDAHYSSYAAEFWPVNPALLDDPTADVLIGRSTGSSAASGGSYWGDFQTASIVLEEDGVWLTDGGQPDRFFVRSSDKPLEHTPPAQLLQRLGESYAPADYTLPIGQWYFVMNNVAAWMSLDEDGTFRFAAKTPGQPVNVLTGAWLLDEEFFNINLLAERAGHGLYPIQAQLRWYMAGNTLHLEEISGNGSLGTTHALEPLPISEVTFYRSPEAWMLGSSGDDFFDLIREEIAVDGEFSSPDDYGYAYSYHVPQLQRSSPDAAAINDEILARFGDMARRQQNAIKEEGYTDFPEIRWSCTLRGSLLSLRVWANSVWNYREYAAYFYDLDTDRRISTREALSLLGISADDFTARTKEAAHDYFVALNKDLSDQEREDFGYEDLLAWTISDENINPDMMVYLDPAGDLAAVVPVGTMAGAGYCYTSVYPFASPLSQ